MTEQRGEEIYNGRREKDRKYYGQRLWKEERFFRRRFKKAVFKKTVCAPESRLLEKHQVLAVG